MTRARGYHSASHCFISESERPPVVSGHGLAVRRARGRLAPRQGHEPRQGALPRRRSHEARPRRLLPLGRRGDRTRPPRAADAAAALPGRHRRRADLPEARAREAARVDRGREGHLPLGTARRRAVRHRGRAGRLGGEPRGDRLPPVALEAHRRRPAGRAADRRRPAARDDVRRRQARRGGRPRGASRDRLHRLAEDVGEPRSPRRRPDRAALGVPGRPALRARVRARDRAARPELVTTAWWKEERGEKVFIDYNQNARDRTIASAYSVRPDRTRPSRRPSRGTSCRMSRPRTSRS